MPAAEVMDERAKIIVIEDDESNRRSLVRALTREGYSVESFIEAAPALEYLRQNRDVSLVVTDLMLPGTDGFGVLEQARAINTNVGVLMITGYGSVESAVDAMKRGADDYSHATLSTDTGDHRVTPGAALDVGLTDDGERGLGAFVYRAAPGHGANSFRGLSLRWLHGADGVDDPGSVDIKVLAIEMVYVPQGAFWAGDGSTRPIAARLSAGKTTAPLRVESEDAIE